MREYPSAHASTEYGSPFTAAFQNISPSSVSRSRYQILGDAIVEFKKTENSGQSLLSCAESVARQQWSAQSAFDGLPYFSGMLPKFGTRARFAPGGSAWDQCDRHRLKHRPCSPNERQHSTCFWFLWGLATLTVCTHEGTILVPRA